jgi:hypothetical protein
MNSNGPCALTERTSRSPRSAPGHSRPGRASDVSDHFRCTPAATDLGGAAEYRDVPTRDMCGDQDSSSP